MRTVKWIGTLAIVLFYFFGVNELTMFLQDTYPTSLIDPYFLVTALLSLVAVLTIQEVWKTRENKTDTLSDDRLEELYLLTEEEVQNGLFDVAKGLLRQSEEINELLKDTHKKDDQLKTILKRRYYGKFEGNLYKAKKL